MQIRADQPVYRSYYTQLPVTVSAQGDFKGILAWLTDLHHLLPHGVGGRAEDRHPA